MTGPTIQRVLRGNIGDVCNDGRSVNHEIVVDAQLFGMPQLALDRNVASEGQFKLFRSTLLSWVISST
jgi:hypothetical protein